MDWRDEGVLLAVRKHGESAAIIEVFTPAHGRHAGVVRGGGGRRFAPVLQPGNQLALGWRARLEDHIGAFTVEPLRARAPALMADRAALAGLSATCALLSFALPEREPHLGLYDRSIALFDALGAPGWPLAYLRWEMLLLDEMGYGLDLGACAVTGSREDLAYVSPKTGRAVSRTAAGDWAPRLLPLPACLLGQGPASAGEIGEGLAVTGHFLAHRLAVALGKQALPEARQRLVDLLARQSASP
ncbi:DNA repair protein RecO [Defluviimonas sp. 20V17]|uniref:DNA repair protein RecO n=1 Tax=Allgaiera indica TaxID=765699 RepID=A0AAN4ZY16_9RHOB|nr:DNA repair protein RecO [Allgaiera indica]KDB03567.1 DNA repair protein RecO [Defluviimonas sp. 20V17]GHD98376.1 DNA repair protein RecO [Allgaiera indica]SDW48423.1 DNA replication and repair protein RecO [Allgaiera indica]